MTDDNMVIVIYDRYLQIHRSSHLILPELSGR